jgi:hypothetical protein
VDARLETGGSRGQRRHSPGRAASRGSESQMNPLETLPLFSAPTTDHGPATGRGGDSARPGSCARPTKTGAGPRHEGRAYDVKCAGGWLHTWVWNNVGIYVYIYIYIHIYIHTYIYIHIYMYVCIYIYMYVYIYILAMIIRSSILTTMEFKIMCNNFYCLPIIE